MDELCRRLARELGAARALLVAARPSEALAKLQLPDDVVRLSALGGVPVSCADLRQACADARAAGRLPLVDNSLATWAGCSAVHMGAQLSFEPLEEDVTLLGFSKDAEIALPELSAPSEAQLRDLSDGLEERRHAWRQASDTAQVLASYLSCHPRLAQLRYPGLKQDPCFETAARTLHGGFGPLLSYRLQGEEAWRQELLSAEEDPRQAVLRLERALSAAS